MDQSSIGTQAFANMSKEWSTKSAASLSPLTFVAAWWRCLESSSLWLCAVHLQRLFLWSLCLFGEAGGQPGHSKQGRQVCREPQEFSERVSEKNTQVSKCVNDLVCESVCEPVGEDTHTHTKVSNARNVPTNKCKVSAANATKVKWCKARHSSDAEHCHANANVTNAK